MIYIRTRRSTDSRSAPPGTHDGENCLIDRVAWRIHNRDDRKVIFPDATFSENVLSNNLIKLRLYLKSY